MSVKISNIAKNTSYFTFALILQKIISFTYFTLIARALGPGDLGKYYFAISFTTIFAIFIDLGLSVVLTREVAKDQNQASKLLSNIIAVKIPLSVISFVIVFAVVNLMGYPELAKDLVYLSSISMILDSFTATFFAITRGFHNLSYESISSVIFQLIVLVFGLAVLKTDSGLRWLIGTLALASLFNFLYSLFLVNRKWKVRVMPQADWALIKKLLILTLPFALYGIFNRVYLYFDSVMLSSMAGDMYVGLYQVAFKIINALQFLPMAFTATLYPAMSSYWVNNRAQLIVTFERSLNYLTIISLPIMVGTIALADKIVVIFKSGYAGAVMPLEITMMATIFIFWGFPIGALLNACDMQKKNTQIIGLTLILSVLINFFLIPRFQAVGASITVLATNFINFVISMYYVPRIAKFRPWKVIKPFLISLLGALVMGWLAFYLKSQINIFAVVAISSVVYFLILFSLGAFKKEDIASIWRSFAG